MRLRFAAVALIGAGCLAAIAGFAPRERAPVPSVAETMDDFFTIDKAHSMLLFRLRHFGVGNFYGRVIQPTGTFLFDDANLAGSYLNITAQVNNMDTGDDSRDMYITGADFFNVREFPTAEFKSSSIRKTGESAYEADGKFTMHGVTKEVTAKIAQVAYKKWDRFGLRCGFEATITVNRSEYGMAKFVDDGTLGDAVTIIAALGGAQLPDE